jgi:heat shock protein HslJ
MNVFIKRISRVFVLMGILLFMACEKDISRLDTLTDLEVTSTWNLVKYVDKSINDSYVLPASYSAEITFHDAGCVYVIAPCNRGFGEYDMDDNIITITNLTMTEIACDALAFEEDFVESISGYYRIDADTLTINSNHTINLVFVRSATTRFFECNDVK